MNINDLNIRLEKDKLLKAHFGASIKMYVSGEKVFQNGSWKNLTDVFGIYKGNDDQYCFFL